MVGLSEDRDCCGWWDCQRTGTAVGGGTVKRIGTAVVGGTVRGQGLL